jgi:integrase
MLGYYTGQRCSDLVKMKYSDVEYDMAMDICEIHVIQKKTGRDLWVPFPEELKDAYQTWVRRVPDNLILSSRNKPYKANALSKAWRRHRDAIPALAPLKDKGLVMHGLRGGCCVRYSRLSLSDHQIGDMIGMSVPMVSRYTRLSNQRANSRAALAQLKKNGG